MPSHGPHEKSFNFSPVHSIHLFYLRRKGFRMGRKRGAVVENITLVKFINVMCNVILRRVFVLYIWGGFAENDNPGQIYG